MARRRRFRRGLRRRCRPRHLRLRQRQDRGWRCRAARRRPRHESRRPPARRHRRLHRDVEPRARKGARARRHPHGAHPVGDKYVLEEMVRLAPRWAANSPATSSSANTPPPATACSPRCACLKSRTQAGVGLDELTADLEVFPQTLVNVRVREKKGLLELPAVAQEIRRAEAGFAGSGRVLVRFSGTEPLARVMVEGPDMEQVEPSAAVSPTPSGAKWAHEPAAASTTATTIPSRCRRGTSSRCEKYALLRDLLAADGVYDSRTRAARRARPRSNWRTTRPMSARSSTARWIRGHAAHRLSLVARNWCGRTLASVGGTLAAAARRYGVAASAAIWPEARTTRFGTKARVSACSTISPSPSASPRWLAARAAVVDLDVHQGDGTAAHLRGRPRCAHAFHPRRKQLPVPQAAQPYRYRAARRHGRRGVPARVWRECCRQ